MNVLARIQAGARAIACGLATTKEERAAVLAQRFRVYQRKGYYRPGLQVDCDAHDDTAAYFLATLPDGDLGRVLLGSARLIFGESRAGFRFPCEMGPSSSSCRRRSGTPPCPSGSRSAASWLKPLGASSSAGSWYRWASSRRWPSNTRPLDVRAGLAMIKLRLLRALQGLGVRLYEIHPARLIYPIDGPMSGYCHHHPDPVVLVYWLTDEIVPSIEQAIARYHEARE